MTYLHTPREVALSDLRTKEFSWSAGMYRRVEILNNNTRTIRQLIHGYDKGRDPGSIFYIRHSTHHFIRTKALQSHSYLISTKGDAIVPLNPRAFEDFSLSEGDILISKDSNVGECAMIDGNGWGNHMISGGIVRIRPSIDRHFLFAFLKHPFFMAELLSKVPRGATIAHANELWLDCRVPFPCQENSDDVVAYVSALSEAIFDKQRAIRHRDAEIHQQIEFELEQNQNKAPSSYEYPRLEEIRTTHRLDTGLYNRGFRSFQDRINRYRGGGTTLSAMGVRSRRGPNLAVSVIGKSLYSETYKEGWYELIRPVNISQQGTLTKREWFGTPKKLPIVNRGDLILGCEGFEKGRSLVLIEAPDRCTTNFHGTVLYWPGAEIEETIFVRCFLAYLRKHGVVDWVGVGGSGGHMSPEYFEYLPFPKFPLSIRQSIARLYHHRVEPPTWQPSLKTFVAWHDEWNTNLGIWELDQEVKSLQRTLLTVQADIIEGKTVKLPF